MAVLPKATSEAIEQHLDFARKLHIETRVLEGADAAEALVDFARRNGVTQIFLARPPKRSIPWLRRKHPAMKILIVAGVPDDDRIFIRAGLEHFEIFPAPFSAAELVATVDAILASRDAA